MNEVIQHEIDRRLAIAYHDMTMVVRNGATLSNDEDRQRAFWNAFEVIEDFALDGLFEENKPVVIEALVAYAASLGFGSNEGFV